MDSNWIDNIDVNEMVYIASFNDDIGKTNHVLAFYYKGYLLVIQIDVSIIVVLKNDESKMRCVYSFNYFDRGKKAQFKKFVYKYKKMVSELTFIFHNKVKIIEEFKIRKRKSIIGEICE